MGQSAGAHIAACALVDQAVKESRGESISWSLSQIKAYFGLSGGYVTRNLKVLFISYDRIPVIVNFIILCILNRQCSNKSNKNNEMSTLIHCAECPLVLL